MSEQFRVQRGAVGIDADGNTFAHEFVTYEVGGDGLAHLLRAVPLQPEREEAPAKPRLTLVPPRAP